MNLASLLHPVRGRGAVINPAGRFESQDLAPDGDFLDFEPPADQVPATYAPTKAKTILTKNDSPDLWHSATLNPYQGCEHGCIYCFARPSHEYMNLSPGLDFETKIFFKPDAPRLLRQTFDKDGYQPTVVALGANTDIYQPLERERGITRQLLEVFLEYRHPVALITKSALILRDADLLATLASQGLVSVAISITTLDPALARAMEPRAATPERRLENIRRLSAIGVPCVALASPMIPGLNDPELESILRAAKDAGAVGANYILVRLPHQNKALFETWLEANYPDKKEKVLGLLRQTRGGKLYQSEFGTRMRGTGEYADLLEKRFDLAYRKLGFHSERDGLRLDLFRPRKPVQLPLLA